MAARPLSLHQLTALDASPAELVAIASTLGCEHVCLFTHVPERARHIYPAVTNETRQAVADGLERSGVSLFNLEVFPLTTDVALDEFRAGLELGASLGARRATAHIHIEDAAQATETFAGFCDLAAEYGIGAGIEFNAFSKVRSLAAAAGLIAAVARHNADIVLDCLHAVRSGAEPEEIAAHADQIGYAQICDGPREVARDARWAEAIEERMIPGDGDFPLAAMLRHLHPSTVIEVEVPQARAAAEGVRSLERARRAVEGARRFTGASAS
jgi:sugar phosphate isomerase/epimerase